MGKDGSRGSYLREMSSFLACIFRTLLHQSQYQFPLSDKQKADAATLWESLKTPNLDVSLPLLHRWLYSLIAEPTPGMENNQWLCPLTCWLALSSIRSDGKFREPNNYTGPLAIWTYHLRHIHLQEAYLHIDKYEDGLNGYVFIFLV